MVRTNRHEGGFTLLEAMIATAILAIGVLGIGSMQGMALRRNTDSTELMLATNLASEMMERIQFNRRNVTAYHNIDTAAGVPCPNATAVAQPQANGDCLQWQASLNGAVATGVTQASKLRGASGTVTVTPVATNPLNQNTVVITVTWGGLTFANRTVRINAIVAPE